MLPTPVPSQYRGSPVVSPVCSSSPLTPALCKAAGVPHSSTGRAQQGSHTPKKAVLWDAWCLAANPKPLTGRLSLPLQHNIPQLSLLCGFLPHSVPPSLNISSFHESLPLFKVATPTPYTLPLAVGQQNLFSLSQDTKCLPKADQGGLGERNSATGLAEEPGHHPDPALGAHRVLVSEWDSARQNSQLRTCSTRRCFHNR